eukprot:903127-Pleurochrysis_carterae.AAC.1
MLGGGIDVHRGARSWVTLAYPPPVVKVRALSLVLGSMNSLNDESSIQTEQHTSSESMFVQVHAESYYELQQQMEWADGGV